MPILSTKLISPNQLIIFRKIQIINLISLFKIKIFGYDFFKLLEKKVNSVFAVCQSLYSLKNELVSFASIDPFLSKDDFQNFSIKEKSSLIGLRIEKIAALISSVRDKFRDEKLIYCLAAMCDRYLSDIVENKNDLDKLSLEYYFFRSRNSGRKLFQDIEEALNELDKPLLECYLSSLIFAFRDGTTKQDLFSTKMNIFKSIYNQNPNNALQDDLFSCHKMNSKRVFEKIKDSYYYTISALLIGLLTLLSLFIWIDSTKNLKKEVDLVYKEAIGRLENA